MDRTPGTTRIRDFLTAYRCASCNRRVYAFTYSIAHAAVGLCPRCWRA